MDTLLGKLRHRISLCYPQMKTMALTPISDCEVRDPRIRRTRQLLQGALQSLLLTRSFEEISVQEIAEAATVNRATFYDHYTDKFALLDALVGSGLVTAGIGRRMRRSIALRFETSSLSQKETADPEAPARAVRPMRWT